MTEAAPDLRATIAGIPLQNPVMTASGTFGYAGEFVDLVDLNRLGAIRFPAPSDLEANRELG